jgi:hypothetical protein
VAPHLEARELVAEEILLIALNIPNELLHEDSRQAEWSEGRTGEQAFSAWLLPRVRSECTLRTLRIGLLKRVVVEPA